MRRTLNSVRMLLSRRRGEGGLGSSSSTSRSTHKNFEIYFSKLVFLRTNLYIVCMTQLTRDELCKWFTYNPETGQFFNVRAWGARPAGREAQGSIAGNGYVQLPVAGRPYVAHRLAWLYVHNDWPEQQLDHINRNKADNRIANLRAVTRSENQLNRNRNRNNTSGCTGVHARKGRFIATVKLQGRVRHLGAYDTFAEARAARRGAEIALGVPQNTPP